MQIYNHTLEQEWFMEEDMDLCIKELESVNKKLSKLTVRKEELTQSIIKGFEHNKEGQQTTEYKRWKIEIKTPFIYSLDKKKYLEGAVKLPAEFNPVKESVAYTVDKRKCDEYMECAPKLIKKALVSLISKKPGKVSVSLKERV